MTDKPKGRLIAEIDTGLPSAWNDHDVSIGGMEIDGVKYGEIKIPRGLTAEIRLSTAESDATLLLHEGAALKDTTASTAPVSFQTERVHWKRDVLFEGGHDNYTECESCQ